MRTLLTVIALFFMHNASASAETKACDESCNSFSATVLSSSNSAVLQQIKSKLVGSTWSYTKTNAVGTYVRIYMFKKDNGSVKSSFNDNGWEEFAFDSYNVGVLDKHISRQIGPKYTIAGVVNILNSGSVNERLLFLNDQCLIEVNANNILLLKQGRDKELCYSPDKGKCAPKLTNDSVVDQEGSMSPEECQEP